MTNFITDDLIKANSKLKVSLSSATGTLTEGVTPVPFNTTDYNVGQGFSYSAGSITCLFDGYVTVQAAAVGTGAWSGTGFALCVYKDGSQAAVGQNGTQSRITVATTLQVSKNEVLQIRLVGGSAAFDGPVAATYAAFSRVAEYSAGSAAGFGLASATSAGLVKAISGNVAATTSNLINITSFSQSSSIMFTLVGDIVTCAWRGRPVYSSTSAAEFEISLPVDPDANFSSAEEAIGNGTDYEEATNIGLEAHVGTKTALVRCQGQSIGTKQIYLTWSYRLR